MAVPETNPNTSGSAPKMDGPSRSTRSSDQPRNTRITRPSSSEHRRERSDDDSFHDSQSTIPDTERTDIQPSKPPTPNPVELISESHDPRQLAVDVADKYLHLGSDVGLLLFVTWGILAFGTLPTVILVVGLIPGLIFNILLFSPKTVYRITEFILDFIPAADVIVEAVDELGLGKVNIVIKDWMKALIVLYDVLAAALLILFISTILISICTIANGTIANVVGKASDLFNGTNTYESVNAFCSTLTH